jgi:hypothetical protein
MIAAGFAEARRFGRRHLYEIPITYFLLSSRIPMPLVTPIGRDRPSLYARLRFEPEPSFAGRYPPACGQAFARRNSMMDVIMIAIGFVFFALSIGYVYACDRL